MPKLPRHTSNIQLPQDVSIFFLGSEDAPSYQKLRLNSLLKDAHAFLSLHKHEVQLRPELFAHHLHNSYHPPYFGYLGLFIQDQLIGYAQVTESSFEKERHIASIYNVYVSPEYRKRGLAQLLFQYIFDLLQQSKQIERIFLTCTASNKTAYRFYQKLGFRRYAVKTRAIKWNGVYDDEIEMVKVL